MGRKKRLTKKEREAFVLSDHLQEILVGLLLGDLYAKKKNAYSNFTFKQGLVNQDYLNHLYLIFINYTASGPRISDNGLHPKTGKIYTSVVFIHIVYYVLTSYMIYLMFQVKR